MSSGDQSEKRLDPQSEEALFFPSGTISARMVTLAAPNLSRWLAGLSDQLENRAVPVRNAGFPLVTTSFRADDLAATWMVVVDTIPQPPLDEVGLPGIRRYFLGSELGCALGQRFVVHCSVAEDEATIGKLVAQCLQIQELGLERYVLLYGLGILVRGRRENPLEKKAQEVLEEINRGVVRRDVGSIVRRHVRALLKKYEQGEDLA